MKALLSHLTSPRGLALLAAVAATATATAQTDLTWDPGTTDPGDSGSVYTHPNTAEGEYPFRITTQASTSGGWRTALRVTAGEANLYIRQGSAPTTASFYKKSDRPGSDGLVLKPDEFAAGQQWFILVDASAGAQWSLVSGEIFVQDLGSLSFTDTNANNAYDIGEPSGAGGSGAVAMGAEGIRFFKATSPPGTPAWSLWLNGSAKDIAVRKGQAPFPDQADRIQSGRLLMVPPYLTGGTDTVFIGITGAPGESIDLDSRIQPVADVAFGSTQAGVAISGAPFKIYRVQVPPEQLGWDVSVTPTAGDANVAVRKGNVAGEFDNTAQSAVAGNTVDAVTVVPAGLSDGTWFITVWSPGAATFTLRNQSPLVTPIAFADTKVNDQPTRAGWRYFALSDINSQLAKLGWQLELTNHVPGTEIAIRRNALPGRWTGRSGGFHSPVSYVDFTSTTGLLNRPGHQADVWYIGVYQPEGPLGTFTLTTREIPAPPVAFDGSSTAVAGQLWNEWRWFRVDVPIAAALKGWELRFSSITSGKPNIAVARGRLPDGIFNSGWGPTGPTSWTTWEQGKMVAQRDDFSGYTETPSGDNATYRRLIMSMGRPLEPGTYYVGVTGYTEGQAPLEYTLESRGIGTGFGIPVTDLGAATTPSNTAINALPAREMRFFHVTVPPGTTSWETVVDVTAGEMVLWARKDVLPTPDYAWGINDLSGRRVQKQGDERLVVLPRNEQDFIDPGEYYLAVASEGTDPPNSVRVGTGTASATLQIKGPLAVIDMGTATAAGITLPISHEAGQIKAYRVLAPAGIIALESRFDSVTGGPTMAVKPGPRLPASHDNHGYSSEFGQTGALTSFTLTTIINPAPVEHLIVVQAAYDATAQNYTPMTADLVVTARTPPTVAFDNGTIAVANQPHNAWRFFKFEVPAGPLGWEFRLTNVTGRPWMVIRRDLLPEFLGGTNRWDAYASPIWPTGNQTLQLNDYTTRGFEPDLTDATYRTMTLAMGRPLEPGTYYVGISSPYEGPMSYTLESRGIGNGLALPVTPLAFSGGAAAVPSMPARRATFYKVTIPANTPSWEITLDPILGEMMMWVRHAMPPDPREADVESYGGARVQNGGQERFVLLPKPGQDFITAGEYYIAAVSEGTLGPNPNLIGTGDSTGTLTSVGPLAVTNLGAVTEAGLAPALDLLGAQVKAYQITVPAGATSLDVKLDTLTGTLKLSAVPGTRLPSSHGGSYFWNYGEPPAHTANEFHVVNPVAGTWSLLIRAADVNAVDAYPPATGTLHLSVAAGPQPLAFNGGTATVTDQALDTWRFFQVEVPAGAVIKGWDLRLANVTSGTPKLIVRRGMLPETLAASGLPDNRSAWPVGASRAGYYDLSHRNREPDNRLINGQFLVSAMGQPLEPGTYFVGVSNDQTFVPGPLSYTLESRGIGVGQAITITDLALNGNRPVPATPARHAAFFKTTVPAATPSWEITLDPTVGDMCLLGRIGFIPDIDAATGAFGTLAILAGGGRFQSKAGPERYVLLPEAGQEFVMPGDYYLAAVSEGVNAGVPSPEYIGTGHSAGTIANKTPLLITNLGTITAAGTSQNAALDSGQYRAFQLTVPAGASGLEVRLDNRVGASGVALRAGSQLLDSNYYPSEGGVGAEASDESVITVLNPVGGLYTLRVSGQADGGNPGPTQADLVSRLLVPQRLNFSSTENGNGFSHTDTRSLLDTQRQFYTVQVPATVHGAEILGWYVSAPTSQGKVHIRVYETSNFAAGAVISSFEGKSLVIAPPFFSPSRTWYLEVEGIGAATYTLTSQPVLLQHAAYAMPTTPGQTFADTGQGVAGDQGIDLGNDAWHFYAFDVPAGNGGLLRAELQALNGNPDLYVRRGGIPTPHHTSTWIWPGGFSLVDRRAVGTATEYANWTPLGKTETDLAPGRYYAAIHASSNTNARYRLLLSTGVVQTLALNGGSVANQNLAPRDTRYYRFTVPLEAPLEWKLTLSEQQGDVRAFIRDVVPPGSPVAVTNDFQDLLSWKEDSKNQGPYPVLNSSGTHTLTTPPLRPGNTYYVGVEAVDTAVFSLNSATAGGTVGTLPVLDFLGGQIDTNLAVGARARWRVPVPADVVRWKHKATHDAGVKIIIEQGTIPLETASHYESTGADSTLTRLLNDWPWVPGQDYYLLLANNSGAPQHVTLTMDGRDAATDDEDGNGIADAWEREHFGNHGFDPNRDLDGDGLTDGIEYVLGFDPNEPSNADLPTPEFAGAGAARRFALDVGLPSAIPPQARIEVYASNTLGDPGTVIATRQPGGAWTGNVTNIPGGVRVEDVQPLSASGLRFLWLAVSLVPEAP